MIDILEFIVSKSSCNDGVGAGQFHFTIFPVKLFKKLYFYPASYRKCVLWFMGVKYTNRIILLGVGGYITVMAISRHDQCKIPSVSLASKN